MTMPVVHSAKDPSPSWWRAFGWAVLVAGQYVALLLLLIPPVIYFGLKYVTTHGLGIFVKEMIRGYSQLSGSTHTQGILFLLFIAQILFLLLPVRVINHRPVQKRHLLLPAILGSILLACLAYGMFLIMDDVIPVKEVSWNSNFLWAVFIGVWLFWLLVLLRVSYCKCLSFQEELCRILLMGSMFTLSVGWATLFAIRFARLRIDFWAGFGSMRGVFISLCVMLFSFGPSVFHFYHDRWERKMLECAECTAREGEA